MAANSETEYPPSPTNEDSGDEEFSDLKSKEENEEIPSTGANNNVADLLKKLQNCGALVTKPKEEYHCYTCNEDFIKWNVFESHLLQHVSQTATVVLQRLPDLEDTTQFEDDSWSDEEEEEDLPPVVAKSTPQKMDISEILKQKGISFKKPEDVKTTESSSPGAALSKLSGLGFTIKNTTPIKQEKLEPEKNNDLMKKLGNLGGLKLKLKSEGNNTNSFKVVNGLKNFNTSDDEENENEQKSADEQDEESDDEKMKILHDKSGGEQESDEDINMPENNKSESENISLEKMPSASKNPDKEMKSLSLQPNLSNIKISPLKVLKTAITNQDSSSVPQIKIARPSVKQTPRRNIQIQELSQNQTTSQQNTSSIQNSMTSNSEVQKPISDNENIVVKKEVDTDVSPQNAQPLFPSQSIKTERLSPPVTENVSSIPPAAKVKTENDVSDTLVNQQPQPLFSTQPAAEIMPPLTVPKQEDISVTIIEINGDSNDEDDDCCVVSTTPAPASKSASDIKYLTPKTENLYPPTSYPASLSNYPTSSASSILSSRLSDTSMPSSNQTSYPSYAMPDTKPICDLGGKGVDDIFDNLFSSKKENSALSDASEYISLDRLGSQNTCDICNTRFTDISMLEDHIRTTGHSKSIITPTSSTLLPYNHSSSSALMSSLFPVKQLAEQVGKLSAVGGPGSGAFTHQQNVMINIQAYPGAGGMMPPSPYNNFGAGSMNAPFPTPNPMYGPQLQPPHGQGYMGQQPFTNQNPYDNPAANHGFSAPVSSSSFLAGDTTPYSANTPLQSMQQAVYAQTAPTMMPNQPINPMGPPGQTYVSSSSPSHMKPPTPTSGIKIKNIQTFAPGQLGPMPGVPVQGAPPTTSSSGQIRIAPNAPRARAPGARPSLRPVGARPGVHVQGPRGKTGGPRAPLKRTYNSLSPAAKRRDMLLPGKHDNDDCQVMSMQKQREGLPMIQRVQGAKDKLNLGSQISITKKTVNKEANAMANVLASRGIMVKQKQKSRSPSPQRPVPHIPNLGSDVSVKHTSRSSNFSIPEAKVGGGMFSCKICKKMFMNQNSLTVHVSAAHPHAKLNMFKCDECPASYPKSLQLQHHKRVFHNVSGANRELGLPVVDLSQEDNLKRLAGLGIYSFIPLANREHASGCFGIPVVSVHNANNGLTNTLQALGADGLLSLGPLKPLPNT